MKPHFFSGVFYSRYTASYLNLKSIAKALQMKEALQIKLSGVLVLTDDVYGVIFLLLLKWYAAHFHCLLLDSLF